jgi:hypothetical protein
MPVSQRGVCGYAPYSTLETGGQPIETTPTRACEPIMFGAFLGVSSFTNSGFSIEPSSLESLRDNATIVWVITLLSLAGNVSALLWHPPAPFPVFYF